MNAEQFFNNGFGADVEKIHRKHVIDLMTNFAKHYHTEQCNITDVAGQTEQLSCETCIFNTHSWSEDYPCATCCGFDKHQAT